MEKTKKQHDLAHDLGKSVALLILLLPIGLIILGVPSELVMGLFCVGGFVINFAMMQSSGGPVWISAICGLATAGAMAAAVWFFWPVGVSAL